MDIAQLFDVFALAPHVESSGCPRVRVRSLDASLGECTNVTVVEQLRIALLWLADQEMKMFGHHHIPNHHELVASTGLFEYLEKQVAPPRRPQDRSPTMTAAGDEMLMSRVAVTFEPGRHPD
jgi:hypothetical protein